MQQSHKRRRLQRCLAIAGIGVVAIPAVIAGAAGGDRSHDVKRAIDSGRARNVILLIGDGMGDSEITIARNYAYGAAGEMALDTLPLTGAMTTYSVLESDPSAPDYTPESASTATAWSTGSKTADGRISTTAGTDQDLVTSLDLAEAAGLRTGIVTTSEVTDATPAAPMAHVVARACQGPANMATCPQDAKNTGGPGSIAEQSIDHRVDVIMGGGLARYQQVVTGGPYAGQTVLQQAEASGYQVITDGANLGSADGRPLLGLFQAGNLNPRWIGAAATNPPSGPQRCNEANPAVGTEPDLAAMTTKAIEILSRKQHKRGRGFFLQVESASIDKRDHVSQPCEQIGETVNFDTAVAAALDFARKDGKTLVIVTGDHAHTSQIVEPDATPAGFSSILLTDENQPMMVTYGTGNTPTGQQHTGSQIRVAAEGPQAANVVGVIDQTEIAAIIRRALSLA